MLNCKICNEPFLKNERVQILSARGDFRFVHELCYEQRDWDDWVTITPEKALQSVIVQRIVSLIVFVPFLVYSYVQMQLDYFILYFLIIFVIESWIFLYGSFILNKIIQLEKTGCVFDRRHSL